MPINQTIPTFRSYIHSAAEIIIREVVEEMHILAFPMLICSRAAAKVNLLDFGGKGIIQCSIIFLSDISQRSDNERFKFSSS